MHPCTLSSLKQTQYIEGIAAGVRCSDPRYSTEMRRHEAYRMCCLKNILHSTVFCPAAHHLNHLPLKPEPIPIYSEHHLHHLPLTPEPTPIYSEHVTYLLV